MGKTRLKVGIFVTVSFFILAAAILWLAGSRFLRPVDSYQIFFDQSVSGLLPGAAVEYQGVTVGKVEGVQLTRDVPPRAAIIVALQPGTPVRTDTSAHLIGSLVTGIRFIELSGGSATAPPLELGGTIPVSGGEFEEFRDLASAIGERLLDTLTRIEQDILSPENRSAIAIFLKNASHLSESLSSSLDDISTPETRTSLKTMVDNLGKAAEGVKTATDTINDMKGELFSEGRAALVQVRQTAAVTANLAEEIRKLTQHADKVIAQTNHLTAHANNVLDENRADLTRLLANLAETSRSLRDTMNTLKQDPSTLVWGTAVPEKEIPDQ